jgi:cytochrome c oxidase subunit 2
MFSGASTIAGKIDAIFLIFLIICVALLVLITFLMIFFVIKYNHKKNKKPENIRGNTWLEITWTVIPTILVLGMFYGGWIVYTFSRNVPPDAMVIKVTGRMWSWLFEYPNGLKTDTLYVPIDKPVKLELHSQDVIHSFFIPAFRIKEDVVPGLDNYQWFQATEEGKFDVLCAEYCGLQHSYMLSSVIVLSQGEYQDWLERQSQTAKADATKPSAEAAASPEAQPGADLLGKRLLNEKGCIACHTMDGTPSVGPTFKGAFGKKVQVMAGGKEREILIDEKYIHKSILEPQAEVLKGFPDVMPPQEGQVTDADIEAIIAYLKELK